MISSHLFLYYNILSFLNKFVDFLLASGIINSSARSRSVIFISSRFLCHTRRMVIVLSHNPIITSVNVTNKTWCASLSQSIFSIPL